MNVKNRDSKKSLLNDYWKIIEIIEREFNSLNNDSIISITIEKNFFWIFNINNFSIISIIFQKNFNNDQ